jgi:two-component system, LuxR family, response regulator FixJ
MTQTPTVFIVDDDAAVRDALALLMSSAHLGCATFSGAGEFLAHYTPEAAGCVLLDVRMPETDGLTLQRELAARGSRLPVIILSGHGDIPMAVQALRAGAIDFLTKPFDSKVLLARVHEAIEIDARTRQAHLDRSTIESRLALLTPREAEIVQYIAAGMPTKSIAAKIGSSHNTVHNQRSSILKKMQAESAADLVRMVMIARPE